MKKLVTLAVAAILIATLLVSLEGGKKPNGSDRMLKYEIAEVLTTLPSTGDSMLNYMVNVYDNEGNLIEKIVTELEVGYLQGDLVDPMEIHTTGR